MFLKIIKNAYLVVVSDAIISDNVMEVWKHRDDNKKILIINEYTNNVNIQPFKLIMNKNFYIN